MGTIGLKEWMMGVGASEDLVQELEQYAEAAHRIEGWELEFEPEALLPGPPWDYEVLARELASRASCVLDLGTGGGEVLERILARSSCRAVATECWEVNAPVAARRLAPHVAVVRASSLELPFASGAFDLVLSRHEEIAPAEIARILAPGGCLLTQQVIPDVWHELRAVFPEMTRFPDHYSEYQSELIEHGLRVDDAREFRRPVRFRKLGHLVYHLVAAPWTIPGFSVRSHLGELAQLDDEARGDRGLVLTEGFYLLQASLAP